MAFSPVGIGRMSGFSVPAILTDDRASLIVHDDGRHFQITSGHRATLGDVAVIRFDDHPTAAINPFGREWLPAWPDALVPYCIAIARSLSPGDSGIASTIAAVAIDLIRQNSYTSIPEMYLELRAAAQSKTERHAALRLKPFARTAGLATTTDTTVLPRALRGTLDPDGANRPFTLYIIENAATGRLFSPLKAAIQTAIWFHATSWGPGEGLPDGSTNGPCPITVVLTDFHRAPAMPDLAAAMSVGTLKAISTIITGSSLRSVAHLHQADFESAIRPMVTAWVIPTQSDPDECQIIDPEGRIGVTAMQHTPYGRAILSIPNSSDLFEMRMTPFYQDRKLQKRAYDAQRRTGPRPLP